MTMSMVNYFGFMFLIVLTICCKYVLTIDSSDGSVNKKPTAIESDHSISSGGSDHNANKNVAIDLPIAKPPDFKPPDFKQPETKLENRISGYSLEGGGVPQQTAALLDNIHVDPEGESHSKGSKGRKGVAHQGSSVVPRKGVDNSEIQPVSSSPPGRISLLESSTSPIKVTSKLNTTESKQNSTNQTTPPYEEVTLKIIQAKKPEVVSDLGDAEDFDTYAIIKSSTTGEDYVIIGIVIVIGIWFSVFGALIFYRRAGEYWDRRHYRRMDFLVEGMYND